MDHTLYSLAISEYEMALNQPDREYIDKTIQNALFRYSQGFGARIRDWGVPAVLAALVLWGIGEWKEYIVFKTNTGDHLSMIEKSLDELRLQIASTDPSKPMNLAQAKSAIDNAIKRKLALSPELVGQTGQAFINSAPASMDLWNAALEFIRYRSVLNEPELAAYHWLELKSPGQLELKGFEGNRMYVTAESIPCAEGSIQAHLDSVPSGMCSKFMLFVGGRVPDLDGNHFRNTMFKNVRIK